MAERNLDDHDVASEPKPRYDDDAKTANERLGEIRQYLLDRRARLDVVATTTTPSGEQVDWVPVESQMADGRVPDPPDEGGPYRPVSDRDRPTQLGLFELEHDDADLGPPGTVPVRRHLVDRISPDGSLRDFLSKRGRAQGVREPGVMFASSGTGTTPEHAHAAIRQLVTCYGTEGTINIWRPYVMWSDEFSLGQLWLTYGLYGTPFLQTVEAGVQTRKDSYGDYDPHVFIYFTTNGYLDDDDLLGGYNQDIDGWNQISSTRYPGGRVTQVSTFGGEQFEFAIKAQLHQGNWWISVNGDYMGFYPGTLFHQFGLRSQAATAGWGGEVYDAPGHAGTTETDMGSGKFPFEGFAQAAYIRNMSYQSDPGGTMKPMDYWPAVSNTDCYDMFSDFDASWGRYMYWGGTGRNSACP
jgi:hypothetical protein